MRRIIGGERTCGEGGEGGGTDEPRRASVTGSVLSTTEPSNARSSEIVRSIPLPEEPAGETFALVASSSSALLPMPKPESTFRILGAELDFGAEADDLRRSRLFLPEPTALLP